MANIRNTRRNYARPSDTFTAATSFAAVTFSNGSATSSIELTKKSNPLGPTGNGTFKISGANGAITGTTTSTASTVTASIVINSAISGSQTLNITEDNYNGAGKPITVSGFNPGDLFEASVLVIGGGGGGGQAYKPSTESWSGGGGAGAYREFSNYILTTGTTFAVTVGAGGATGAPGANGNSSKFHTITANGGGGGAHASSDNRSATTPPAGGSGGGAAGTTTSGSFTGGVYSSPNSPDIVTDKELYTITGTNGGNRSTANRCGGGGGAVDSGQSNSGEPAGGSGRASSITGSSVTRAGGGGGGEGGPGGAGGGGNAGNDSTGFNGTANTGGGGGGTNTNGTTQQGGSGGSGVVIIKIPDTFTASFSGGVTSSLSTSVAGFNIYSVTATSTTSETVTFSAA